MKLSSTSGFTQPSTLTLRVREATSISSSGASSLLNMTVSTSDAGNHGTESYEETRVITKTRKLEEFEFNYIIKIIQRDSHMHHPKIIIKTCFEGEKKYKKFTK